METTKVFEKIVDAWDQGARIIDNEGGTRSGKTYATLQFLVLYVSGTRTPVVASVVSETLPHLKRGAIRDFENIMRAEGLWEEKRWSKVDHIYKFPNGSLLEFFSADTPGKVHGPARSDLFINECQNIPYDIYRQLAVRTTHRIILDYNPTHHFWVHDKIKPRRDCVSIHSTYKDNTHLTPAQIAEIEANKDDKRWWRVYGEGKEGILEGLIYDFQQIDELPDDPGLKTFYGLDFGFTNDPTACVQIKADTGRRILYVDEVIYQTGLLNSDIVERFKAYGVPRAVPVYADCAEPKSIAEIFRAGYNVKPCDKNAPTKSDKLKFQIQFVQGWRIFVTKRSVNLIKELRNYTWAQDKDGNALNYPIDSWNHALDAMRYGVFTHLAERAKKGYYNISIK